MKHPIITKLSVALLLASNLFTFTQCVAPYETARMLPKGNTAVQASYTYVGASSEGESDKLNDGLGLGVAYGITDKWNFKLRYERLSTEGSVNFLGFGPKYAIKQDRIAAALPFWTYFVDGESTWGVSPMLLFGLTKPSKKFEANIGLRGDIPFEEGSEFLVGLNAGFGFSKDLDRYAIRPDIGFVFNPGEKGVIWTLGLGAQYIFQRDSKE